MSEFQNAKRAGAKNIGGEVPSSALPDQPTLGSSPPDSPSASLPLTPSTPLDELADAPGAEKLTLRQMLLQAQGRDPHGAEGVDPTPRYTNPDSLELRDYVRDLVEQFKDQAWDHDARERVVRLATTIQVKFAEAMMANASGDEDGAKVADREMRMALGAAEAMAVRSALTGAALFRRAIWDWTFRLTDMLVSRIVPPAAEPHD